MATLHVRSNRIPKPTDSAAPPRATDAIARSLASGAPWMPEKVERGEAPLDAIAREDMIRTAAYLRAECRGFEPGHELEDWLAAEHEIDDWIATRAAPQRHSL